MAILIFLSCGKHGHAQNQISLDRHFSNLRLDHFVYYWKDSSKSLEFPDLVKLDPIFTKNGKSSLNFGYNNSFYWLKTDLINQDSIELDLMLEIDNPHLNKLQLFIYQNSSWIERILTGDHFPFPQREILHPHFIFRIKLAENSRIRLLMWVDKHGEQIQIPMRLWNNDDFHEHNDRLQLFWGIMVGISSIFIIFSFLLFVFYQRELSFYYCLYTLTAGLFVLAHTGIGFQHLWPQDTWWQSAARPSLGLFMYVCYLLFARSFFEIKSKSRRINTYILTLCGLIGLLIVILWTQHPYLNLFKEYWYNSNYYNGNDLLVFIKSASLLILISLFSILFIGLYYYFLERKKEALWFVLSFIGLLIGGSSVLLVFSGIISDNIITQNIPLVSNSIETMVFALLVANRFNNIQLRNNNLEKEVSEQKLALSKKLIDGQLLERKRLSQQLHDGINVDLANIRLKLSMIADALTNKKVEVLDLVKKLGQTGTDIRRLSHDLSPSILHNFGLSASIEELILMTNSAHPGLQFEFHYSVPEEISIPEGLNKNLYYIIKELIMNIVKHSKADRAQVKLIYNLNHSLSLLISDDGVAYDPALVTSGLGLLNVKERISSLNGKMEIIRLKKGMIHQIVLPIQTI